MNYFEFYEVPISFEVDEAKLRTTFYAHSKKYHPDFYTMASEEEQEEALRLSTLNNEAYKVLNDFDKRMKYILEIKNVLGEEGKNQIPQDFLMDMMEINEPLMELQFDFDEEVYQKITRQLKEKEDHLYNEVKDIIQQYDDVNSDKSELEKVKSYYLKMRYLLRVRENLDSVVR